MAKIEIYNEEDRYTPEAIDASKRINAVIRPLFEELVAEGFNSRELSWLMQDDVALCDIMHRAIARNKK